MVLLQLTEQLDRTSVLTGFQCGLAANSKDRDQLEQLTQLSRRSAIKAAVSAAGNPGDLAEDLFDRTGIAFLKHKDGDTRTCELIRGGEDLVLFLLERIADQDQGRDLEHGGFTFGLGEDLSNLCTSGAAVDLGHQLGEMVGVRDPT